jgi:hypothetical protein
MHKRTIGRIIRKLRKLGILSTRQIKSSRGLFYSINHEVLKGYVMSVESINYTNPISNFGEQPMEVRMN